MAAKNLPLFFFTTALFFLFISQTSASASASASASVSISKQQQTYTNYVKTSCNSTTYPSLCLKSLLPYAAAVKTSPLRLAKVALSATLKSATATLSTVSKLAKGKRITKGEAAVLKDCIENIQDSIDKIKDSLKATSSLVGSADKRFLISNAQTWTSAAITDDNTCIDGFSERKVSAGVKKTIRNSIVNVARLSSNALYLINHLQV